MKSPASFSNTCLSPDPNSWRTFPSTMIGVKPPAWLASSAKAGQGASGDNFREQCNTATKRRGYRNVGNTRAKDKTCLVEMSKSPHQCSIQIHCLLVNLV